MSGRSLWIAGVALCFAVGRPGPLSRADDSPTVGPVEADPAEARAAAANERALDVIDLILAQHIDPPTRAQMLRSLANGMYGTFASRTPPAILSLADRCTDRDESRLFLNALRNDLVPIITARAVSRFENTLGGTNVQLSFERVLQGAVLAVAPGRTHIVDRREVKAREQIEANLYVGIGVMLVPNEMDTLSLRCSHANTPAAKAGVLEGDLIESIDGHLMNGATVGDYLDRIRGPEGTQVTLVVRQPGLDKPARTLTIRRSVIPRDSVHGWEYASSRYVYRVAPSSPIAYVRIAEISGSTIHELQQVEQQLSLEGVKALVLDLRASHGGTPHFALLLSDALLDGGAIGRMRTKAGAREYTADRECLFRGWPLAVLINENTRGTSAWIAQVLQDNRRAVILGESFYREAFVYTDFALPGGKESLRLATGILERPSGQPLMWKKLGRPDIPHVVDSSPWSEIVPDDHFETIPTYVHRSEDRMVITLTGGPDEAGVKKARDLLQAKLDVLLKSDAAETNGPGIPVRRTAKEPNR